jgi:hypothetical protein
MSDGGRHITCWIVHTTFARYVHRWFEGHFANVLPFRRSSCLSLPPMNFTGQ